MKINLHSPLEEVQVQIIPLIDVIFCILTFFLLAALQFTRQQAISIDLPKASTGTTPQVAQRLLVSIDSVGQIYVEQQPVQFTQLTQALQPYIKNNPGVMMVLNASRSSSYNDVVRVLDKMREVGGDRVALSTLPGSDDQLSIPNSSTGNVPATIPYNPSELPAPTIPDQSLNGQSNGSAIPGTVPSIPPAPTPQPQ